MPEKVVRGDVTMTREEYNDIMSDNLAASGCNQMNLGADGTVGPNIRKGLLEFVEEIDDEDNINLMIRLLRVGGYNDALNPDGEIGTELIKAFNTILEENGQEALTSEELKDVGYPRPKDDDEESGGIF